jgi:hypothetical protein
MNLQNGLLPDLNIGTITYYDKQISYRIKDNYVNATVMCQLFNKSVREWLRYDSTKEYISILEIELGIKNVVEIGLGFWIHPILINEVARWINNEEFIYWCEDNLKRKQPTQLTPRREVA